MRRPQYTIGWDWGPRVVTCGIVGTVELRKHKKAVVREVRVVTENVGEEALLSVSANVELLDYFCTEECDCLFTMKFGEEMVASKRISRQLLTSGYNYLDFDVVLKDPKLWWPNGYGEQNLYTVEFKVIFEQQEVSYPAFSYGVRTVELDLTPVEGEEEKRYFALKVNGVRVFCKGGDWIPADSIYARVSTEKYRTLISEAAEANFNTLRVWGGGIYEREIFYDLCDKYGILLWHDFMFACSTYPDHRPEFREECRKEMDYQTKRLRNRACIGLFCGNNEDHEIFYANSKDGNASERETNGWGMRYTRNRQYGMFLSNVVAKEVLRNNCPQIPYWPSSPYGGKRPTSELVGDVHHWGAAMMNRDVRRRIEPFVYDELDAKFVSEYGYIGPCSMDSIKEYLGSEEIDRESHVWKLHTNSFEKQTVLAGIAKHYPVDADSLTIEEYIRLAGSVHSMILGYSLEAIRFKEHCYGAIFWMYNDTWGEVGWTIIDYYLRRKIGYYGVKRAFAEKKLTLRKVRDQVVLQACNDTPKAVSTKAKIGYLSFDGKERIFKTIEISVPAHTRAYVHQEDFPEWDYTKGVVTVIPESEFEPCVLRVYDYPKLQMPKCQVEVKSCVQKEDGVLLTLVSPVYAHFVEIKGSYKCSDNYFDLLPGQEKTITVLGAKASDIKIETYNEI